jgi:hypothetical protein
MLNMVGTWAAVCTVVAGIGVVVVSIGEVDMIGMAVAIGVAVVGVTVMASILVVGSWVVLLVALLELFSRRSLSRLSCMFQSSRHRNKRLR